MPPPPRCATKKSKSLPACYNRSAGDVVKLVYTLVLGTSAERREGSSPFIPTTREFSISAFARLRAKAGARSCWKPVFGEKDSRWFWKRKFEPTRLAKI